MLLWLQPRAFVGKAKRAGIEKNQNRQRVDIPRPGRILGMRAALAAVLRVVVHVAGFV